MKKKKSPLKKIIGVLGILFFLTIAGVAAAFYFRYEGTVRGMYQEAVEFVKKSNVETFRLNQASTVYTTDGTILSRWKGEKDITYVEYADLPVYAGLAIVSIEDKRFFEHDGVDYIALLRAGKAMIETGELSQGGSTITMQLARNTFLNQEKNWKRKLEEIFIAWKLEEKYDKEEILEFYLNNIYYGNGYYGIGAASKGYFNKTVNQLNLSQIAFLCAIPNNPTLYDPITNMENTLSRRNRILKNMLEDEKISNLDYETAIREEIVLERPMAIGKNDYAETYAYHCAVRVLMEQEGFVFLYDFENEQEKARYEERYHELYNICEKRLRTQGYQIYTSLDLSLQEQLQRAVDEQLFGYEEVNEEGVYQLQASAVCINNETGFVEAIVGGRSQEFGFYTLNRAYQSYRQPGSVIKPLIVYTPMLERGYTAETLVVDEEIKDGPKNVNGTYLGEITLQEAVEKSVNVIAWKLFEELTPSKGLEYLKKMNFSHLNTEDYRLPSALGGFNEGVSALEVAAAYAALQYDGIYREPTCVKKILDAKGNVIFESKQEEIQVYQHNAARAMTSMLVGVMEQGTGSKLKLNGIQSAGKTGTTNEQKDGWFAGYTRYYTTSVWVGYDMPQKMESLKGNTYPGRIWQQFMNEIHKGLQAKELKTVIQPTEEGIKQVFTPKEENTEQIEDNQNDEIIENIEGVENGEIIEENVEDIIF